MKLDPPPGGIFFLMGFWTEIPQNVEVETAGKAPGAGAVCPAARGEFGNSAAKIPLGDANPEPSGLFLWEFMGF